MADTKRLERIESKIDKVVEHIGSIDVTLAKQSVILDEHIRRTNILEKKFEPVEEHVASVHTSLKTLKFALKILAILGASGGLGHTVLHYLMKLY
jgi:hypothetical protein